MTTRSEVPDVEPMTDEELTLLRARADHEQRRDTWLWFSTASNAVPRLLATIAARNAEIEKARAACGMWLLPGESLAQAIDRLRYELKARNR